MGKFKYKVGDKVKFIGSIIYSFGGVFGTAKKGDIFEISAVGISSYGADRIYSVKGSNMENKANWLHMETQFELVESAEPKPEFSLEYVEPEVDEFDENCLVDCKPVNHVCGK